MLCDFNLNMVEVRHFVTLDSSGKNWDLNETDFILSLYSEIIDSLINSVVRSYNLSMSLNNIW